MQTFFRPLVVLPLALLVMALAIATAFCADCVRVAGELRARVATADDDLLKIEREFVELVKQRPRLPQDVVEALQRFDDAAPRPDRQAGFENLTTRWAAADSADGQSASQDADAQRYRDRAQGLINRWKIARPAYEAQAARWNEFRDSLRGRTAQRFGGAGSEDRAN